jgi:hypothetical protein
VTGLAERRAAAERMAYSLGIALYLRPDGTIAQFPPGERIAPPANALPTPHGLGPLAAATP